uniref:Uncharacterized protein n=1 Tax=Anguilla anguilla TaxID=7936 RepID=A0A0E9VM50_ANGAN
MVPPLRPRLTISAGELLPSLQELTKERISSLICLCSFA